MQICAKFLDHVTGIAHFKKIFDKDNINEINATILFGFRACFSATLCIPSLISRHIIKDRDSLMPSLFLLIVLVEIQDRIICCINASFIYSSMAYNLSWAISVIAFLRGFLRFLLGVFCCFLAFLGGIDSPFNFFWYLPH